MSTKQSWVRTMCDILADIEEVTLRELGEEKGGFFVNVSNDWMEVTAAVRAAYPKQYCLVHHAATGLWKEVAWFHFFFVSGNYPLLLSRLRFVWESVFRASLAEKYVPGGKKPLPRPGPSLQDKFDWLHKYGGKLDWNRCIEPILRRVHPLADREKEVRDHYHQLWQYLNLYVHPSAYLAVQMVGESSLLVTDNFDREWATRALAVGSDVFDLVWLTILHHYPMAFDRLKKLLGGYRTLDIVFDKTRGSE